MVPVASSATANTISTFSSVRSSYSGQCFPEDTAEGPAFACADNPTYYSHKGLPCSFHAELISASDGENCFHQWLAGIDTGATWLAQTYDQNQIFELIWECPCACNVKCFDSDDDDAGREPTASPTRLPTMQDKELDDDPNVPVGVNANDQNQQTADSRSEEEDADEIAPSVVAPAVAVDTASAADMLQGTDAPISTTTGDESGFHLSDSLEFVAMIAGTIVGLVVMYVSVFSLIQNMRKRKRIGSGGKIDYHRNDRNDLQLASSLSDISESVASVESLNTEDKMRLYKAWRLATKRRGGIEDGFDVVEP